MKPTAARVGDAATSSGASALTIREWPEAERPPGEASQARPASVLGCGAAGRAPRPLVAQGHRRGSLRRRAAQTAELLERGESRHTSSRRTVAIATNHLSLLSRCLYS